MNDQTLAPTVHVARPSDDAVIDVITLAFATDPAARWSFPDPQGYLRHFPAFIRAFGGRALAHGSAYVTDDHAGAALWLGPNVQPDEKAMTGLIERTTPEKNRGDVFALLEQMGRYHPTEPHWYLPMIGVDPARQGKGYGSALMEFALAACDRDGLPAYLESTNPRNAPLYERHGFEAIGTMQAGSSPPLVAMLRKARTA